MSNANTLMLDPRIVDEIESKFDFYRANPFTSAIEQTELSDEEKRSFTEDAIAMHGLAEELISRGHPRSKR